MQQLQCLDLMRKQINKKFISDIRVVLYRKYQVEEILLA